MSTTLRSESMGSSPHTRGAPGACSTRTHTRWDHPRIRGEHLSLGVAVVLDTGDHPRIRGEHGGTGRGKEANVVDHPRIRGEHRSCSAMALRTLWIIPAYAGSTPSHLTSTPSSWWIIPAYAGSTGLVECEKTMLPWDHPRIRGEHLEGDCVTRLRERIIPAYAGSTLNDLRNYTPFPSPRFGCQGTLTHQQAARGFSRVTIPQTSSPPDTCSRCSIPFAAFRASSRHQSQAVSSSIRPLHSQLVASRAETS